MYCSKCGNQLPEGAKFCDACGEGVLQKRAETSQNFQSPQNIQSSQSFQSSQNIQSPQNFQGSQPNIKPAKKHKGLVIIVSAIAAVLILGFVVYSNAWKIMPGKTYYSYLELKNKPITFNQAFKEITAGIEIKPFSKEIELSIDSITGMESMGNRLQDFTIQAQIDYSKDKLNSYLNFKYMNNILLDALVYGDKDILGVGLPLVYDNNFIVNKNEISKAVSNLSGNDTLEQGDMVKSGKELMKDLDSDTKILDKSFSKYSKLVLDNIPAGNVEVSSPGESIPIYTWNTGRSKEAKEIEHYRQVVIKLSEKDLNKIADKVLEELKNDDVLLDRAYYYANNFYIRNYIGFSDEMDKDEVLAEWKDSIESARDDLSDSSDDEGDNTIVTMTIIADDKNNIISREFSTPDGTLTYAHYLNESKEVISEINVSEGRMGLGNQLANVYVYDGESGKGIKAAMNEYGTPNKFELSYVRSDEGVNKSGLGYGDYKAALQTGSDEYAVTVANDKNADNKTADMLKVRVQQNSNELLSCNVTINDLKNKSNLKFNKNGAIDLAETDESELQDIFMEIEDNFSDVGNELSSLMYSNN